jgi:hypothetical protein
MSRSLFGVRCLLVAGFRKAAANNAAFVRGAENHSIRDIFPTCSRLIREHRSLFLATILAAPGFATDFLCLFPGDYG